MYLYRYSNYVFLTPSNISLRAAGSSPQGHSEVANMRMGVEEGREWSVERNMAWNVSVVTSHQELMRGIKTTEGATRLASRNTCKESWTVQQMNTYKTILGSHVTICGSHVTILGSHVTILGSHVTVLGSHVTVLGSHVTILGSHMTSCGSHMTILSSHVTRTNAHVYFWGA